MAGKFVLKKGSSGKYHFNLVAGNGEVIATSETYERKQSALHGIESVKQNAPGAEVNRQLIEDNAALAAEVAVAYAAAPGTGG